MGRGRVNHITAAEAEEAQDVVLGKFPVNSVFGLVLFDSGASHSFITKDFVVETSFSDWVLTDALDCAITGEGNEDKFMLSRCAYNY